MALYWTCEGLKFYAAGFLNFSSSFYLSFFLSMFIYLLSYYTATMILGLIHSQHLLLALFVFPFLPFCISNLILRSKTLLIVLTQDLWRELSMELLAQRRFPIWGNVLQTERGLGKGRETDGRQKRGQVQAKKGEKTHDLGA